MILIVILNTRTEIEQSIFFNHNGIKDCKIVLLSESLFVPLDPDEQVTGFLLPSKSQLRYHFSLGVLSCHSYSSLAYPKILPHLFL
jgi:hypothetical protein